MLKSRNQLRLLYSADQRNSAGELNLASQLSGAILAGGKNQRMGRHKALLMTGQQTFIEYQYHFLKVYCERVFAVSDNLTSEDTQAELVPDALPGQQGPLIALYSAMRVCRTPYLMTLPCDAIGLPETLITELYQKCSREALNAVYLHADENHYLIALHRCDLVNELEERIFSGMRGLKQWYSYIGQTEALSFFINQPKQLNINTLEDYAKVYTS